MSRLGIRFGILTLLATLGMVVPSTHAQQNADGPVYIVPVQGMIERGLVYVIRRGVGQAIRSGASAIVLDMETPGGRLDATEEIINIISDVEIPTLTYVNNDAISAGAIIALATDTIAMAPGARIGDAMPIMMSPLPMGGAQSIPEDLKEKAVSPTVALIRSAAERNGHDPDLAEAMVRIEFEYRIGEAIVCPAGELLTLTDREAATVYGEGTNASPLLSVGTFDSLEALLEDRGYAGAERVYVRSSIAENVARFIEGFPMSGLLLAAGLLCIYIEFKTPGLGLPGLLGVALLALWFWGHHIAGLAGMGEVILFLLGVALIFAEIFLIPGFGIAGIAGISFVLVSLVMAMVEHYPGGPIYPPPLHLRRMVIQLGTGLTLAFAGGVLLGRYLPETRTFQKLMLLTSTRRDDGYTAADPGDALVGLHGVAVSALHPSGIGKFGRRRMDVVARGTFIEPDTPIVIAEAHGSRIVVEASSPEPTTSEDEPAKG